MTTPETNPALVAQRLARLHSAEGQISPFLGTEANVEPLEVGIATTSTKPPEQATYNDHSPTTIRGLGGVVRDMFLR